MKTLRNWKLKLQQRREKAIVLLAAARSDCNQRYAADAAGFWLKRLVRP